MQPKATEIDLNLGFAQALKLWRQQRKVSQLELSLSAEVSQRHISWLETGRSQPSREMVLRLSESLDIPLRERNRLLNSAGFASVYTEHSFDAPELEPVKSLLSEMLDHHLPYPAYVMDRHWNILMQNSACDLLFLIPEDSNDFWYALSEDGPANAAILFTHPKGVRPMIKNFDEIIAPFVRRLQKEAMEYQDDHSIKLVEILKALVGDVVDLSLQPLLPTLPVRLAVDDIELKLTTVISTFGTAQDITAQELRLETFYPTDQTTRAFFQAQTDSMKTQ